jgi:hypothetical protein
MDPKLAVDGIPSESTTNSSEEVTSDNTLAAISPKP